MSILIKISIKNKKCEQIALNYTLIMSLLYITQKLYFQTYLLECFTGMY